MYKTLKVQDKSTRLTDCNWSPNSKQIAAVGSNKSVSTRALDKREYFMIVRDNVNSVSKHMLRSFI